MDTDEIKKLIDELEEMSIERIALGGGEPLVREDIYEILDYIKSKKIRVSLSSNGLLLTDENIKKLKEIGIDAVQISIDSSKPEIHDEFRGYKGLYQICRNAIKNLQNEGIPVIIATTINKENINEIENIMHMVKNYGVKMHRLIRFVPVGRGENAKGDLYVNAKEYIPKMLAIRKKFISFYQGDSRLLYGMPIYKEKQDELAEYTNPNGCEACKVSIDILPNGNVVPCNYLGWEDRWVAGNVRKESLKHILENSPIIKEFKSCRGEDIEGCKECEYNKVCGKGCRAVAFKLGNLKGMDPYCLKKASSME